jgi:manganese/zinc/iron transport system permease protein
VASVLAQLGVTIGYNTAVVLAGVTLLGVASGVIGSLAVLRRRTLMGDTLAHATLPGIALAFILASALGWETRSLPLLLAGAAVTGGLGLAAAHWLTRSARMSEDGAMAAVLGVFFGAGVALLSYVQTLPTGGQAGLSRFILGQTAAMSAADATTIGVLAVVVTAVAGLLLKEFRLICFDRGFAAAQGWPVGLLDAVLLALVGLVTIIGLQAVGLVLVVAMLITPAAAARFFSDRLSTTVVAAGVLGGLSGLAGGVVSALVERAPAGAVIVLAATAVFAGAALLAPRRGLLPVAVRRVRAALEHDQEHVLRAIYELTEADGQTADRQTAIGSGSGAVALRRIAQHRPFAPWRLALAVRLLRLRSLLGRCYVMPGAVLLTPDGLAEAARLTRLHRLFERYLILRGGRDAFSADDPADFIEHGLSPAVLAELEASVAADAPAGAVPPSPHRLEQGARP